MKILMIYARNDWLVENTTRQRFREITPKDYMPNSLKVLTAAPLLGLATVGMSNGMHLEGTVLYNTSMHILKEMHNGIGNAGKNNCRFIEPIDMTKQARLGAEASASPELPFSKIWLVTDEQNEEKAIEQKITRGVLFHSRAEAEEFNSMYDNLEHYTESPFYERSAVESIVVKESDLDIVEHNIVTFLEQRENWLLDEVIVRDNITMADFEILDLIDEDGSRIIQEGSPLVRIEFPSAVSTNDYSKYFAETEEVKIQPINIEHWVREEWEGKQEEDENQLPLDYKKAEIINCDTEAEEEIEIEELDIEELENESNEALAINVDEEDEKIILDFVELPKSELENNSNSAKSNKPSKIGITSLKLMFFKASTEEAGLQENNAIKNQK